MNGKEDTPNTNPTEDDTFEKLRRISFDQLIQHLNVYWIDDVVVKILSEDGGWEEWGGNIDPGGWTRPEFAAECQKRLDAGEYTKEQYLSRSGL
jgi:hypothetical protein